MDDNGLADLVFRVFFRVDFWKNSKETRRTI